MLSGKKRKTEAQEEACKIFHYGTDDSKKTKVTWKFAETKEGKKLHFALEIEKPPHEVSQRFQIRGKTVKPLVGDVRFSTGEWNESLDGVQYTTFNLAVIPGISYRIDINIENKQEIIQCLKQYFLPLPNDVLNILAQYQEEWNVETIVINVPPGKIWDEYPDSLPYVEFRKQLGPDGRNVWIVNDRLIVCGIPDDTPINLLSVVHFYVPRYWLKLKHITKPRGWFPLRFQCVVHPERYYNYVFVNRKKQTSWQIKAAIAAKINVDLDPANLVIQQPEDWYETMSEYTILHVDFDRGFLDKIPLKFIDTQSSRKWQHSDGLIPVKTTLDCALSGLKGYHVNVPANVKASQISKLHWISCDDPLLRLVALKDFGMSYRNELWETQKNKYDFNRLVVASDDRGVTMFVKNLSGRTLSMDIGLNAPIYHLKALVQNIEMIDASEQRLIWYGKQPDDDKTLAYYGIERESTFHLVLRLR